MLQKHKVQQQRDLSHPRFWTTFRLSPKEAPGTWGVQRSYYHN